MFDYRVVCVYPVPHENEGLENLDPLIVDELERSIAGSIEDGWEFVLTSSIRDSRPITDPTSRRAQTFVYRKSRVEAQLSNGDQAVSIASSFGKLTEVSEPMNVEAIAEKPANQPPISSKSLLTLAILNAVVNHTKINPETVLTELRNSGEISASEERALNVYLKENMTAEALAGLTPDALKSDLFRASLLPFSQEDEDYVTYNSELAFHLGFEERFVTSAIRAKQIRMTA